MPMTEDAAVMKAAVEAIGDTNPLLYCATAANLDAMGALAKEKDLPLVLKGDDLDNLAELSEKADRHGAQGPGPGPGHPQPRRRRSRP